MRPQLFREVFDIILLVILLFQRLRNVLIFMFIPDTAFLIVILFGDLRYY